jgi:hypothetical protein
VDLTTIFTICGVLLGVIVGDAAIVGSSLYISMTVPNQLENNGFGKATAEGIFVAEVNRYLALGSLIATPSVTTSSSPALPNALAKPLQLDGVVYAIQAQLHDYGVVNVTASLTVDGPGPGLKMFTIVSNPPDPPVAIALAQPDGNPAPLIKSAARATMISIAPYMVAKQDFQDGVEGDPDGFEHARATIAAGLAQPWDPRTEGATETALLINLRGLLAIHDGNLPDAGKNFAASKQIPGASAAAYALIALNQAFLAVARKQPAEAELRFKEGAVHVLWPDRVSITARVKVLGGLVAWSAGDVAAAEQAFHAAIALIDNDPMPHLYLAKLMKERGDAAGAQAEQDDAVTVRRFDPKYPPLAQSSFLIDPVNGGCRPVLW